MQDILNSMSTHRRLELLEGRAKSLETRLSKAEKKQLDIVLELQALKRAMLK